MLQSIMYDFSHRCPPWWWSLFSLEPEAKTKSSFIRSLNISTFRTCLLSVCFIFFLSKASRAFLLFSTNCINSWIINILIMIVLYIMVLLCLYPAHKVRLVDPIVPGAVLTEAEKDGVDGHAVNTNEGVGYQVSEQDWHCYLGPEVLHFFVFLDRMK